MAVETLVGKLSSEALGKVVTKSEEIAKAPSSGPSFKEILSNMESGADFADMIGVGKGQDNTTTAQMGSIGGEGVDFTPADSAPQVLKPESSEKVLDMLSEVNKGQMQMDSLVNHVLYSGKKFSNQELLVIQAHVFHFAQVTELTVKVAEHAVSSTKAVLNTQVQ